MIRIFLSALCVLFFFTSDLYSQNSKKNKIGEYEIISRGGINYTIIEGKELRLYKDELNHQGPVSYDVYVYLESGKKFSLTEAFYKKLEAQGRKVRRHTYPETKPFIRYTSPKTGKAYKFYDVLKTPEGRVLTREEFNSFKGNFTWGRKIDGGAYAMDTSIIIPPNDLMIKKEEARKEAFKNFVGSKAPNFSFKDIQGATYSLNECIGKVVVLNFWFTNCSPCIKEIPKLNELQEKYSDKAVLFLAPATDNQSKIEKFLLQKKFHYHIIPNAMTVAKEDWNVLYYPSHFIIDKEGYIRLAHEGYNEDLIENIDNKIKELLKRG